MKALGELSASRTKSRRKLAKSRRCQTLRKDNLIRHPEQTRLVGRWPRSASSVVAAAPGARQPRTRHRPRCCSRGSARQASALPTTAIIDLAAQPDGLTLHSLHRLPCRRRTVARHAYSTAAVSMAFYGTTTMRGLHLRPLCNLCQVPLPLLPARPSTSHKPRTAATRTSTLS